MVELIDFQKWNISNNNWGDIIKRQLNTLGETTKEKYLSEFKYKITGDDVKKNAKMPTKYEFQGCFRDNSKRAIPTLLANVTGNNEYDCAKKAKEQGYNTFGIQYNGECWGLNTGLRDDKIYGKYGKIPCTGGDPFDDDGKFVPKKNKFWGGWENQVYQQVPYNDPAYGCEKDFEAKYKCGTNASDEKKIHINGEARGKIAHFDCNEETNKCNNLRLVIHDTGFLSIEDGNNKTLWDNKNDNIVIPKSFKNDKYKTKNGKNGRNYISAGEFLKPGEWIGTSDGQYRLLFDSTDLSLKVTYNKIACEDIYDRSVSSTDSLDIYNVKINHKQNMGKIGYINNDGKLQIYPDSMLKYDNSYEKKDNINIIGDNIFLENNDDNKSKNNDDCNRKCNDSLKCAGYLFYPNNDGIDNVKCKLLNNNIYRSGIRVIDNNSEYYIRNKKVSNSNESCNTKYTKNISVDEFESKKMLIGNEMTPDSKCGLKAWIENENENSKKNKLEQQKTHFSSKNNENDSITALTPNKTETTKNIMMPPDMNYTEGFENIHINNKNLRTQLIHNQKSSFGVLRLLYLKIVEMITNRDKLKKWSGKELQQLEAINEDIAFNMISNKYKKTTWSILAIILFIYYIKISNY